MAFLCLQEIQKEGWEIRIPEGKVKAHILKALYLLKFVSVDSENLSLCLRGSLFAFPLSSLVNAGFRAFQADMLVSLN